MAKDLREFLEKELERAQEEHVHKYLSELYYYSGHQIRLFTALSHKANADEEAADLAWKDCQDYIQSQEHLHQDSLDVFRICEVLHNYTKFSKAQSAKGKEE